MHRIRRPSPALALALIALFVALGGTGYAAISISGSNIKNGTVTGKDVKNKSLGKQDLSSAARRTLKGDQGPPGLQGPAGPAGALAPCSPGSILGYARLKGQAGAGIPSTFTSSPSAVDNAFNCTGGTVEVRREGPGDYLIRFNGNAAPLAFAQVRYDDDIGPDSENCATVRRITSGADLGAFRTTVTDCGEGTVDDSDVTFVVM